MSHSKNHIHLLPACGKLSAGLAILMNQLGYEVRAYDPKPEYPMKSVFDTLGLTVATDLPAWSTVLPEDTLVLGNSVGRGHPWVEAALVDQRRVWSMPEWLCAHVLRGRYVIAVAGTHGKTSVTAMIAWLLRRWGKDPGYLIGGVCHDLPLSAHRGTDPYFVIEADEYDTAWFDKRAKFFWYWPSLVVLNHVEYDHPDIYPDLSAMHQAYRWWLRMVSPLGWVCLSQRVAALNLTHPLGGQKKIMDEGVSVTHESLTRWVYHTEDRDIQFEGLLSGQYHAENLWCAAQALSCLGFDLETSLRYLQEFKGVVRRMTPMPSVQGAVCYDDFAHHPTAIRAAAASFPSEQLHTVLYPANAFWREDACLQDLDWTVSGAWYVLDHPRLPDSVREAMRARAQVFGPLDVVVAALLSNVQAGDIILSCSSDDMTFFHDALHRASECQ